MRSRLDGVVLEANARGSVRNVHFLLDGVAIADDTTYPYTLGSEVNRSRSLRAWAATPIGRSFTLGVTVEGPGGRNVSGVWRMQFA